MPPWVRPLVLAALAATLPVTLHAQARPDSTAADSVKTLPPIEVVGSVRPFAGPQVNAGIPARVTTLSGAQIDQWEPRLLSEVLGQVAGFSNYDDLGTPYKLNIQSRGFYASPVVGLPQGVSVFLDGIRVNDPDAAQVNWDLLPMEHIKRVEIVSGNGTLAGRNSLGGSINLITQRGEGDTEWELEGQAGMYGTYSGEGSVSGRTRGGFDYYLGGGYNREGGWRQDTRGFQWNTFLNVGKLEETRGIRLQALYARGDARTAGSLPESVFEVQPDSNLTGGDFEDLRQVHVAVAGYQNAGAGRFSGNVAFRANNAERFNVNQPADPDFRSRSRGRSLLGTFDYRFGSQLGRFPLGVRVGVDGSANWTRVQIFADSSKFGGGEDRTTFVESPIWDVAGFATADLVTGRVTWSAGGRFDWVRAPFFNRLDPARDTTQNFRRFNPRLGVNVDAGGGASIFGSWGQAFRAPSVIEIACADPEEPCPLPFALGDDPPINPVTTSTFEVGARYQRAGFAASASVYRTNVRNEIVLVPFEEEDEPEGSTIDGYFINIDRTRREGLEAQASYTFGRRNHLVYANYAFTRATYQTSGIELFSIREEFGGENEIEPGDRLPLVPDHQVKFGGRVNLPKGFNLGLDGRFIGRQFLRGDEANEEEPLASYFVADARAGWAGGGWEVNAIVNNVLDNDYANFGTFNINQRAPGGARLERFLTPGPIRMLRVIVRRSFGG